MAAFTVNTLLWRRSPGKKWTPCEKSEKKLVLLKLIYLLRSKYVSSEVTFFCMNMEMDLVEQDISS